MAKGDPFIYSLIGFVAGIIFFFSGFKLLKKKRLIENMPTSKIRSIAMGLVEIYGSVKKKTRILKSPFTNKNCVYYKSTIEELRGGKNKRWVIIRTFLDHSLFYLKDETGEVVVNTKDAKIDVPSNLDIERTAHLPKTVTAFLKKNKVSTTSWLGFNKRLRFREYVIKPNDKLYILGTAGANKLARSSEKHIGTKNIMIQKGRDKIYYISNKHETEILKSLRLKVVGCIYGGAALSAICLTIMLIYLRIW